MISLFINIYHNFRDARRQRFNRKNRQRLVNKDFSLIANNCNGSFILHDLYVRFNTPTINLFFKTEDYLRFLSNLKYYLSCELNPVQTNESYPVGQLDDIKIYFMHYSSFEEAKQKWQQRNARVDYQNLFIMMSAFDCADEVIRSFNRLPYDNKVIFANKPYPDIQSACYIRGFERSDGVGHLFKYKIALR